MIDIFVQSRYSVDRVKLQGRTVSFLKKLGINANLYGVSIAIVGDRKMASIHKKYANKSGTTPVLAFSMHENVSEDRKDTTMLGEIIISYPQTVLFAADESKLVDDKLGEFIEHGITTLLSGA